MRTIGPLLCIGCLLLAGCPANEPEGDTPPAGPTTRPAAMADHTLSGPFTHKNLAVFLVHSRADEPAGDFVTLDEAVKAKTLVVHETGDVGQLAVENNDPNASVYIQAGFIVKGGRQDRVLAHDLVVPPKSGKVQIASLCVESGRWTGRGAESAVEFNAASKIVAGSDLKYAAKHANDQGLVWASVARAQADLSVSTGVTVNDLRSQTSMQLALENPEVEKNVKAYSEKLADITKDKADVIGMVVVVNGEVRSADVYTSRKLFAKLWPTLLESAATEALRDFKKDKPFEAAKTADVQNWLADTDRRKTRTRELGNGVQVVDYETGDDVMSETLWSTGLDVRLITDGADAAPVVLHRSLLVRPADVPAPAPQGQTEEGQQTTIRQFMPLTDPYTLEPSTRPSE